MASGRFESDMAKEPVWFTLEKLSHLKAEGALAFGLMEQKKTSGESRMEVDWVKIEPRTDAP